MIKEEKFYLYRGRFNKNYWLNIKREKYDPAYNIEGAIIVGYGCFFYVISKVRYDIGKLILIKKGKMSRCSLFGKIKERRTIYLGGLNKSNQPPEYYPFIRLDITHIRQRISNVIIFRILERKDYIEVYE